MATQDNLQEKIDTARKQGYSDAQIRTYLSGKGVSETSYEPVLASKPEQKAVTSTGQDVGIGVLKEFGSTVKLLAEGAIANTGVIDPLGFKNAATGVVDQALPDEKLKADNPAQMVGKGLGFAAEALTPLAWSKFAHIPTAIKAVTRTEPLIVNSVDNVDDVAKLADEVMAGKASPSQLKGAAEGAATQPTFTEKIAGLSADVKNRIKGKGKLLSDYLNIMDARNSSDLVPTPLEYASSYAQQAKTAMEGLLSDTGSAIGAFRNKIGTYKAGRDPFNTIRDSFEKELGKLNLAIKNGKIDVAKGKISQTVSESETKALQGLYDDLNVASENPSLENLIDLRNKFDNKINFDKSARDVSGMLDSLSRRVRKSVADVAEKLVGKSEAKNLDSFSKFMDAYNDLRSYVDRKAGAEFLLKCFVAQ